MRSLVQFHKRKAAAGKSALLTDAQQEWLTVQQLVATTRPEKKYASPANLFRRFAFNIVQSKRFDTFMMVIILINVGTMCLVHYGQSKTWTTALDVSNLFFTVVFIVEMILKMSAIGIHSYFHVS